MAALAPKIVGVVSSLAELERVATTSTLPVDWVEVRFDSIPETEWTATYPAIDRLERAGTTVLATIRLRSDGGTFERDDASRVEAFRAIVGHASAIDIEIGSAHARELVELAHANRRRAVVSHHDFARTPDVAALRTIEARGRALGADLVKISTMVAEGPRDHDALLALLAEHRDGTLAVIGMGPLGVALRAYAPAVGSALAYGYLDRPSAPGQLSATELDAHLRLVGVRG